MDIVRICDGKRGHENQSLGLVESLARLTDVRVEDLTTQGKGAAASLRLATTSLPAAQLVIGAGHATHLPLLLVAHRTEARSVVLMKPSLPRRLFDLCVVPVHDGVSEGPGLFLTLGALNRIRPAESPDRKHYLVLIGGPSRHNDWSDAELAMQIRAIRERCPGRTLHLVTSRRTPASTLHQLADVGGDTVLMRFDSTHRDWLSSTLPRAATVWVTEDSVSMGYEAASAGAQLGLLHVPRFRPGRTRRAVDALLDSGRAVSFEQWRSGTALQHPEHPLAEADRCARAILQRWPELT